LRTQSDEHLREAAPRIAPEAFEHLDTGRWYVVQTQPHAENRAVLNLRRQDYRVFCPRLRKTVRHARRSTVSLVPLFPGYVFLHLDVSRRQWRSVNGTFGVARLIMQGDLPQPVPRGVIELLLDRADADGGVGWAPSLKPGQPVRISEGPFAGLVAILEQLDENGRVRVLLKLLGRSVCVALHGEVLTPAD
jgi:transcription elongation factor/antiterminator RfaH